MLARYRRGEHASYGGNLMDKFLGRVFPPPPVLGVTLVVLLLMEGIAIASTVVTENGFAFEGSWTYKGYSDSACHYTQ